MRSTRLPARAAHGKKGAGGALVAKACSSLLLFHRLRRFRLGSYTYRQHGKRSAPLLNLRQDQTRFWLHTRWPPTPSTPRNSLLLPTFRLFLYSAQPGGCALGELTHRSANKSGGFRVTIPRRPGFLPAFAGSDGGTAGYVHRIDTRRPLRRGSGQRGIHQRLIPNRPRSTWFDTLVSLMRRTFASTSRIWRTATITQRSTIGMRRVPRRWQAERRSVLRVSGPLR